MNREEILAAYPLAEFMRGRGEDLVKRGGELYCRCPFHEDNKPSFRIDEKKRLWTCDACGIGGTVIDLFARLEGIEPGKAMKRLAKEDSSDAPTRAHRAAVKASAGGSAVEARVPAPAGRGKIVAEYSYFDEFNRFLFQVVRYEPKGFAQRRKEGKATVWNLQGVRRVLYRLPEVLKAPVVWIVEGEKDVETMRSLGFTATCNPGGAGKWMDGYAEFLEGKEIVLCPDNDAPGRKHMDQVLESIAGKVQSVRQVEVPAPNKDVSELVALMGAETAKKELNRLYEISAVLHRGIEIPVLSMAEMERIYIESIKRRKAGVGLSLGKWLPGLGNYRVLVPGELLLIMADTGVGKTAALQNIVRHARPMTCLVFELELPPDSMFERQVAVELGMKCQHVESSYRLGERANFKAQEHVWVCPLPKMTLEEMGTIIDRSELKIGKRPDVVFLDYIQLMQGKGTRYERLSDIADGLKRLAREAEVILVVTSQVSRPEKGKRTPEVTLHDAKDTGNIENSAGMILGLWRDPGDRETMFVRVLKCTKGAAGLEIECFFEGETLRIWGKGGG